MPRGSTSTSGWTRPWATLASLKNLLDRRGGDYEAYMAAPTLEQYHFIGKDIITFHAVLARHAQVRARAPTKICVHGFMTVNNGEKMSKSRGTGLDPLKYLGLQMNPSGCATTWAPSSTARMKTSTSTPMTSWPASIPT
ncbi:Methionine--tRNA ligase, mitochondrial [Manis javanica]|nr:Methionine--tRNA ligase, mitochondrial [Manis javanica]